MLDSPKEMFSDDEERRPLMTEEELRDACLHATATIVVAFVLGCEFKDCLLADDGFKWPTSISGVYLKYPESWRGAEAFPAIVSIHEAACQAVAKRHGRGPHRINNYTADRTSDLLDEPRIWRAIGRLAEFIRMNDEGEGCYGALGADHSEPAKIPKRSS